LIFKAAWRQQDQAALAGDDRPGSDLTGIPRWRVAAVEADQMGGTNSQPWALGGRDGSPPCTTPNAARSGGLRGLRWAAGAGAAPVSSAQRVAASAGGRAVSAVVRRRRIDGDFPSTRIGSQFIMCSGAVWETAGDGYQPKFGQVQRPEGAAVSTEIGNWLWHNCREVICAGVSRGVMIIMVVIMTGVRS